MNDIANGLREEIERCEGICESYMQTAREYSADNEPAKMWNMVRIVNDTRAELAEARIAIAYNDPERMAAALEALRGIKE